MDKDTYDQGYMASLPPQLTNLMALATSTARQAQGMNLWQEGFLVDGPIMVELWDPYEAMQIRNAAGLTWIPSYGQPPLETFPNVPPLAGQSPYDPNNPPPGSIKVYWPNPPASVIPIPPPVNPPTLTLGPPLGPEYPGYYSMIGDSSSIPIGQTVILNGVTYTKTLIGHSPFAPNGNITGWIASA